MKGKVHGTLLFISRDIKTNRPNIVIKDNKQNIYLLIDMERPSDRNLFAKENGKISKYKEIGIEKMWHHKTTFILIINGAVSMIKRRT